MPSRSLAPPSCTPGRRSAAAGAAAVTAKAVASTLSSPPLPLAAAPPPPLPVVPSMMEGGTERVVRSTTPTAWGNTTDVVASGSRTAARSIGRVQEEGWRVGGPDRGVGPPQPPSPPLPPEEERGRGLTRLPSRLVAQPSRRCCRHRRRRGGAGGGGSAGGRVGQGERVKAEGHADRAQVEAWVAAGGEGRGGGRGG